LADKAAFSWDFRATARAPGGLLALPGSPIYRLMCSRYSLTSPPEAVRATFAYRDTPNFPVRYNIAPTQDIGVVLVDADGQRRFRMMRWGLLPSFVKDPKAGPPMINARAEGISTKSAFRRAFAERRCLVPADGFYEWTGLKGARRPFLLRPRQGGLIAFPPSGSAGWIEPAARPIRSPSSRATPTPPSPRCMTACRLCSGLSISKPGSTAKRRS
jgi:hypothetical protein